MSGYLIEVDLRGRTALVVGLGAVGRRKAGGLVRAGARVVGVDPAGARWEGGAPDGVEVRPEEYRVEHLNGVALAFAAATPGVNARVVADARAAGVWVNAASGPPGDFRVPAVWRQGGVTLGVATSGASPALAAALRDRAAAALGEAAAGLAGALGELRPLVRDRLPDPAARRRVLADWGDPRWLALFESGGAAAVRAELERRLAAERPG